MQSRGQVHLGSCMGTSQETGWLKVGQGARDLQRGNHGMSCSCAIAGGRSCSYVRKKEIGVGVLVQVVAGVEQVGVKLGWGHATWEKRKQQLGHACGSW